MNTAEKLNLTEAEYLALDLASEVKHEFVNGEAWAMAGGTLAHSLIANNVGGELRSRLRGKPCRAYQSDLRVHVAETGLYAYPDVTVVCGSPKRHPNDDRSVLNPRVIFEVLSESTAHHDRGAKFRHYRRIPELAEYVLVTSEERLVERYRRLDSGEWVLTEHTDGEVELTTLGISLPLDEIYEGVDFGAGSTA